MTFSSSSSLSVSNIVTSFATSFGPSLFLLGGGGAVRGGRLLLCVEGRFSLDDDSWGRGTSLVGVASVLSGGVTTFVFLSAFK